MIEKDLKQSVVFPVGEKIENEYFVGDAYLSMLTTQSNPIGNVTFAPNARNNWHVHEGGQILLVTGGEGYYQEEGKVAQRLKVGDVVEIAAGIKHWHGAASDSWFVHLAIVRDPSKGETNWLEPVSESQYQEANRSK
ncbi:cupin domain-containing protein [Listeria booriae]|uniref:cupin domain-containing protein n=1 Tax=Listeria booriae TaxID=1552123 RepID=UPI00162864B0|nr:cupin domain-containing protein [Listeria booriae]MBC1513304.1 cupin domain-containing protein [Listeria booriae]MBC6152151.1 cupin domain-containing protein [Listeria booriae]MBC6306337.1 cupin domain-containing protein [Listeria booriae]